MNSMEEKTYRTSVLLSDGNKIVCEWGSLPDTLATALAFAQEFGQVIDVEENKEDNKQQLIMQVNWDNQDAKILINALEKESQKLECFAKIERNPKGPYHLLFLKGAATTSACFVVDGFMIKRSNFEEPWSVQDHEKFVATFKDLRGARKYTEGQKKPSDKYNLVVLGYYIGRQFLLLNGK